MSPVYRYEQPGESGVTYPTLAQAMRHAPWNREACIRTSAEGVVLAEACPVAGVGTVLVWVVTNAGRDVEDMAGWTCGMPALSERESDTVLAVTLAQDLARAS